MKYHKEHKIEKEVTERVRTLIKTDRFYRQIEQTRLQKIRELSNFLSDFYKIKQVEVRLIPNLFTGPCYDRHRKIIFIDKNSIISFLHEWKHHHQYQKKIVFDSIDKREHDAIAWSLSVFYSAVPRLFLKSAIEGKIAFTDKAEIEQEIKEMSERRERE